MSFTSFPAVIFLAIVCAISILLQKRHLEVIRKYFLLIASYLFVALVDWRFCISIFCTTVAVYAFYRTKRGKPHLLLVISLLLLQLACFKYLNFFADSISAILGRDLITLNLIIPLGISFYTFSAISYVVDVYKGKFKERNSFADVALYLAFFPKLMAGPIIRAEVFFLGLKKQCFRWHDVSMGLQLAVSGAFKKMVLADNLNVFVNDVFFSPNAFDGSTCLWALLSYSLQIYFDFSGYSDMAIGISRILGFEFPKNFNLPYASRNVTEFWKRWHISLSSWLMEYLYFTLGGNRKGVIRTYVNLVLTMLIGGLWHGAAWTFVLWGGLHGLALVIHKLFVKWKIMIFNDKNAGNIVWKWCSTLLTFVMVSSIWVFFRADSFDDAITIFYCIGNSSGINQIYTWTFVALAFALFEIVMAYRNSCQKNGELNVPCLSLNMRKFAHMVVFWCIVGLIIMTAYLGDTSFIYGKF